MFNRGIAQLLEGLPDFDGLDPLSVKRLLTSAYLEGLDLATLATDDQRVPLTAGLRRLVMALEVHAIVVPGVTEETRRACAFVAAESLNLLDSILDEGVEEEFFSAFGSRVRYRRVEAGLLYLIAAFDANAAIAVRGLEALPVEPAEHVAPNELESSMWALRQVLALVRLSTPSTDDPAPGRSADWDADGRSAELVTEIRVALWQRVGGVARQHLLWLRLETEGEDSGAVRALTDLEALLQDHNGGDYADIAHLVLLLRLACEGTGRRALRGVDPPPDDPTIFEEYLERRCRDKPLLWPSAESYRDRCLPGPKSHAAVAMPTGAGKSGVAELAVAQALARGWVLYLVPTRALVAQVRRDLRRALGGGVTVREFLGGAEFTALADETLETDPGQTVLVMTPEKCSLALRQTPEAFAKLALCVFDECHLMGEPRNRGVLAELVVSQVLYRAPDATVLMQSALLKNPEDIAAWLENATGAPCEAIREPWRPTRTLRAVAGFDPPGTANVFEAARADLLSRPNRVHLSFSAPLNLLVNLQGAWAGEDPADYALAKTRLTAPLRASKTPGGVVIGSDGYVNAATGAVAQGLVEAGHRVLAFIPANKHHNFSVARDVRGFGDQSDPLSEHWQRVEHLLDIADFELGVPSILRSLLAKGVAVHTSAMLQEERRASELAYDKGIAKVVFATSTLAQGLNLPATAVVIGGINIGYDPELTNRQRTERQQAQLLNAVGRAGRPYVAARSLAIVLPNDAWELGPADEGHAVRAGAAPFLAEEDASSALRSQLGTVVREALQGELTLDGMGEEGLTAFAFLPLRTDVEEALGVLRRTYALAGRTTANEEEVRTVAASMVQLGEGLLSEAAAPDWLVEASYSSGLSLRQVVAMWVQLRTLDHRTFPENMQGWASVLVSMLGGMPYEVVAEMLRLRDLEGSKMRALAVDRRPGQNEAWAVVGRLMLGWLSGSSLTALAAMAVKDNAAGDGGRGNGNPLPKIIGLTEQLIIFGMTRIAGALSVLIQTAVEREPTLGWQLSEPSEVALETLSLGIRAGCGDEGSLIWWRFGGLRHRRLAHLAARLLPPPGPSAFADEDAMRDWARRSRSQLLDPGFFLDESNRLNDAERNALTAAVLLEGD